MKNREKIKQFLMSSDERNQYLGLRLAIQTGMHISEIADIVFNYGWTRTRARQACVWEKEFLGYKFLTGYCPEDFIHNESEMLTMYVHRPNESKPITMYKASFMQRFYPEVKKPRYQIIDIKQMSIDVLAEIINSL